MSGLIVFDFDNTLVHSRIDFAGIRRELIELLGRSGHPDAVDNRLAQLSIGQIIEAGATHDPTTEAESWRIVLEYETAGMVAASIEPDAGSTLRALRDGGYQLAVMTNNARPATIAALDLFDLRAAFDLVVTRDEAPMKPDPAGILVAMRELGASPVRTAMVGDSWMDGTAARAAGVPFVGFRPRPGLLEERGVPYWAIVEQLSELALLVAGPWPIVGGESGSEQTT